jgi:hypothetical protein
MKMNILKLSKISVYSILIFILFSFCHKSFATTYYISKDGNDNNPGTLESPWQTINKANSVVIAGDVVYIREGSWNESINPRNSGGEGNYITYKSYFGEIVTLTGGGVLLDLSNRSYIEVDGIRFIDQSYINFTGAEFCILKNCFVDGFSEYGGLYLHEGARYNKILNNSFQNGQNLIYLVRNVEYNIIEGNHFGYATHECIGLQGCYNREHNSNSWANTYARYNIIRNNVFESNERALALTFRADWNLIEDNLFICGVMDETYIDEIPAIRGWGWGFNIIRRNIIYRPRSVGIKTTFNGNQVEELTNDNKYYNNIIANNLALGSDRFYTPGGIVITESKNEIFKNNIFHNNRGYEIRLKNYSVSDAEFIFQNNNFFHSVNPPDGDNVSSGSGTIRIQNDEYTLQEIQTNFPTYFQNNIEVDPVFLHTDLDYNDYNELDFRLNALNQNGGNNHLIDAGAYLTTTIGTGSNSTVITVNDASYFYDGWGIPGEEADHIQVGSNDPVQIINIDYENNEITVDGSISWNDGEGVSLPYNGIAPDIGVHESSNSDSNSSTILVHNTFESGEENWGGAIGNTSQRRDNSTYHSGNYSMHVYTTGAESKLSLGTNPQGWALDRYPFLAFAYRIPENVPVGLFFETDAGWISLGGTENYDPGSYSVNDANRLNDDNTWQISVINVKEDIRQIYPSAQTVFEFEWYTQNNGQIGDEFWFDEVMILSDITSPFAWIYMSDPSPTKEGLIEIKLTISKNVSSLPSPLIFTSSDNSIFQIPLQGTVPGNLFSGTFNIDHSVVDGLGFFSLANDALIDDQGNTGNTIISGASVKIDKTRPSKPLNFKMKE